MPISFNKTFTKCNSISHYYVFNTLFLEWAEAETFCDKNYIPYDFIVKTKYYVNN